MVRDRDYWRRQYFGLIFAARHGDEKRPGEIETEQYRTCFMMADDMVYSMEMFEKQEKEFEVIMAEKRRRRELEAELKELP